MENIRLSRATYQLIEHAVTALECIGRELERTGGKDTDETNPGES